MNAPDSLALSKPIDMADTEIAVVGGGVLGMYLSWRLRERGAAVTLYEAAPQTGGLASAESIGEFQWDRFYHVMLLSDGHLMKMLSDLQIDDKLLWGVTKTGFFTDGQLVSMSNAFEFLQFPPLRLIDKLRLGATIFYASKIKNWRALEGVLAIDWLRNFSGQRVLEKIWLPLLKSKLGENYRGASAAFIWAIIARMYAARRAGLKREMFGYVEGGYQTVLRSLQHKLDELGVVTHYGSRVDAITNDADGVLVSSNKGTARFSASVLTVPASTISKLCSELDDEEKTRLNDITYQGIICPSFLIKKSISPYYVTNITDGNIPFTGVIEMTALVDKKNFGGHALVYLPQYLTQESEYWNKTDEEISNDCLTALERMYRGFSRDDVVATGIARARQVLAVTTLNYSESLLPAMHTSLPNVFVLNSAQIAHGTLNVNETLGIVNSKLTGLASAIISSLPANTRKSRGTQ